MNVRFDVEGGFLPADNSRLVAAAQRELEERSRVVVENAVGQELSVARGSILEDGRGVPYRVTQLRNQRVLDVDGKDTGLRRECLTLQRLNRKPTKAEKKAQKRARVRRGLTPRP